MKTPGTSITPPIMDLTDLQAFSTRAAAEGLAMCPASVLIAGTTYAATVPEPSVMGGLISGGETMAGALVVRITLALLATAPAVNQPLRWKRPGEADWRTEVWWIDDVKRAPIDAEWRITCSPQN